MTEYAEHNSLQDTNLVDFRPKRSVSHNDSQLKKVVRIRLLSDPGYPFWDVSYIWGILNDGTPVRITPPETFTQIQKGPRLVPRMLKAWPHLRHLCYVNDVLSLCS